MSFACRVGCTQASLNSKLHVVRGGQGSARHHRPHPPYGAIGKPPSPTTPTLCHQRRMIEIMFGRLKDWRRIHTRYDGCARGHVRHRRHRRFLAMINEA